MRILVTRPAFLAEPLCQKMEMEGFIPERFPVMDILPTPQQAALIKQVASLPQIDIAIFTSRSAAYYGGKAILDRWGRFPAVLYCAIGPGTQRSLQQMGCRGVLIASPPFESESLLDHPALQTVQGKKIFIFQGKGGRTLLFETLVERFARVTQLECYQRHLPKIDKNQQQAQWQQYPIEGVLLTSLDGLKNLLALLGEEEWAHFQALPFVVVGARLQQEMQHLGIQRVITTEAADDATLIKALKEMRNRW